jgi:hypothetical protein
MALSINQDFIDSMICEAQCCLAQKYTSYLNHLSNGDNDGAMIVLQEAKQAENYIYALRGVVLSDTDDCLEDSDIEILISRLKDLCGCGCSFTSFMPPISVGLVTGYDVTGYEALLCDAKCCLGRFYSDYLCSLGNGDSHKAQCSYGYAKELESLIYALDGYVLGSEDSCLDSDEAEILVSRIQDLCGCLDDGLSAPIAAFPPPPLPPPPPPPPPIFESRTDYVFPYQYSGTSTTTTDENALGWVINRVDYTNFISPITLSANGAWSNRFNLIYT